MYWAFVFLAVALAAAPFAVFGIPALSSGVAGLVMVVFAVLSIAAYAVTAISRHR